VVAHPDDEIIFLGGVLHDLLATGYDVDLVAATGAFRDDPVARARHAEFRRLGRRLGLGTVGLGLPDAAGALSIDDIANRLTEVADVRDYDRVYTHGVFGEYGHQHHVDVCTAVHRVSQEVLSLAGPLPAERTVAVDLDAKRRLMRASYPSQGFAISWCSPVERLVRLDADQVEVLRHVTTPTVERPPVGAWSLVAHLAEPAIAVLESPGAFPDVQHVPEEVWRSTAQAWSAGLRALRRSEDGLDKDLGSARAHPANRLGPSGEERS
jgi:LmbE family N-acetylglucosaminyl deacetylase